MYEILLDTDVDKFLNLMFLKSSRLTRFNADSSQALRLTFGGTPASKASCHLAAQGTNNHPLSIRENYIRVLV